MCIVLDPATAISIHAPRVGCDSGWTKVNTFSESFQSTHPVWGATTRAKYLRPVHQISIHAPRVGCDCPWGCALGNASNFNPRTPCGVRLKTSSSSAERLRFQSTHPVWGATSFPHRLETPRIFQSTHPVWGATPQRHQTSGTPSYFNPRTPCGVRLGATQGMVAIGNFNPRTPCGVRPFLPLLHLDFIKFQSTHPVWGATRPGPERSSGGPDFNPRTPCGVRL